MARSGGIERARAQRVGSARRRELRDVRHTARPHVRIEQVTVATSGIYVITNRSPQVKRQRRRGLVGAPGDHDHRSTADLQRARIAADLVAALVPPRYRGCVRAVLCGAQEQGAEEVGHVLLTSPETLEHIVGHAAPVLSTSEINQVGHRLSALTEPFPLEPAMAPRCRWRRWGLGIALAAASSTAVLLRAPEALGPFGLR